MQKAQQASSTVGESLPCAEQDKPEEEYDSVESICSIILFFIAIVVLIGAFALLIYVLCFAYPSSSEEESSPTPISESVESGIHDKESYSTHKPESGSVKTEKNDTQETSYYYSEPIDSEEKISKFKTEYIDYDVKEHSTDELIAAANTLNFLRGSYPKDIKPINYPSVKLPSDDPIEIAKLYATLRNEGIWTGFPVEREGIRISYTRRGEMEINDVPTGVRLDEGLYYDIAEELYRRGDWDGTPMELGSHTISLSEYSGCLLVDDYIVSNLQECLDLPEEFDIDIDSYYAYIPGKGAYVLSNGSLIKFVNREATTIPGGPIHLKGINLNERSPYRLHLSYNPVYDKLLLFVETYPNAYYKQDGKYYETDWENIDIMDIPNEPREFLYIFPDYNVSKVKLVSEITDSYWTMDDEVRIKDVNGNYFELGKDGFYKLS